MRTRKTRVFPDRASYERLVVSYLLDRGEEWALSVRAIPESLEGMRVRSREIVSGVEDSLERAMGLSAPAQTPLLLPAPPAGTEEPNGEIPGERVACLPGARAAFAGEGAVHSARSAEGLELSGVPGRVAELNARGLGEEAGFMVQLSMVQDRVAVSAGQPARIPVFFGFATGIDSEGSRHPLCALATCKGPAALAEALGASLTERVSSAPVAVVADPFWDGMGPEAFPGWGDSLWVAERDAAFEAVLSLVPKGVRPEWDARLSGVKSRGSAVEAAGFLAGVARELESVFPSAAQSLAESALGVARGFALAGFGVSPSRLSSASLPSRALEAAVAGSRGKNPAEPASAAMEVFASLMAEAGGIGAFAKSYVKSDSIKKASQAFASGGLGGDLDIAAVILESGLPLLPGSVA